MKVGDLVRYKDKFLNNRWNDYRGIILRCIDGTDKRKVVAWTDGTVCSYREEQLEVIK